MDELRSVARRAAIRTRQRAREPERTTRATLVSWARTTLRVPLIIVSNREPYAHASSDATRWTRSVGGLAVALDAVAQATGATWIAHGSAAGDRAAVDEHDHVACPPDRPSYTLRRVWLSDRDHALYYAGFANSGLWPLCHIAYVRPRFRREEWERYVDVNKRFAQAIVEEAPEGPALVFLQDYHLALAARFVKALRPDLRVALFWHIPWPNAEVFRRLPWGAQILDGMLANDVVGFHIRFHAMNFLQSVADKMEARVDMERLTVTRDGHCTHVRDAPIGVDADELSASAEGIGRRSVTSPIVDLLGQVPPKLGIGIDRMDYTKGIPERFRAIDRLFETHPEWLGRFRFLQIAVPSRIELEDYRQIAARVRKLARSINEKFASKTAAPPIVLLEENVDFRDLLLLYAAADVCMVTSLHDGMNLVAKEYVAARPDLHGALILSPFTGAARELSGAWIVSPFDRDGLADALHGALSEDERESVIRMRSMRAVVLRHTVFDWAMDMLGSLLAVPKQWSSGNVEHGTVIGAARL